VERQSTAKSSLFYPFWCANGFKILRRSTPRGRGFVPKSFPISVAERRRISMDALETGSNAIEDGFHLALPPHHPGKILALAARRIPLDKREFDRDSWTASASLFNITRKQHDLADAKDAPQIDLCYYIVRYIFAEKPN
jgi:hypothetical protein